MRNRNVLLHEFLRHDKQSQKVMFIVMAIVILILLGYSQYNKYFVSYTGTVVTKYEKHVPGSHPTHYYITIKTNDGRLRTIDVPFDLYSRVKVGTWLRKRKGESEPRIVTSP